MRRLVAVAMAAACGGGGGGDASRACRDGTMQPSQKTLRERWRASVGKADELRIAIGASQVVVRADDDVVGFAADDGSLRFRVTVADGANLAIAGETVVMSTLREGAPLEGGGVRYEGELVGLHARTGEERWRTATSAPHVDRFLIDGDRVYFTASATATRKNLAHALDATTGAIAWTVEVPGEAELIAIAGGRGYAVGDGVVLAIELATGATAWERPVEQIDANDGLALAGGRVYVGFPWRFEALAAADGAPIWTGKVKISVDDTELHADRERAVIVARKVYVHTDPPSPGPGDVGTVMIGFGGDGRVLFEHDVRIADGDAGRRRAEALAFAGDRVVVGLEDRLQVYSLCDLSVAEAPLGGKVAAVAVGGKVALAGLASGELVAIELP